MPKHPYMGFPFPYNRNLLKTPHNFPNTNFYKTSDLNQFSNKEILKYDHAYEPKHQETIFNKEKNKSNNNNDNYLFDLFGLKLYTDDVLLVSLIYFLYSEGVKDESLFVVLILLLLS